MPLTQCRECNHEISSEAKVCPHCGCPTQASRSVNNPPFLIVLLIGMGLLLIGAVLVWDSLLWLLPEPYNVPDADWKEFGIGFGILSAGTALCILGCARSAEKGHWLTSTGKSVIPASCVGLVILSGLLFKIEIHGPYWFTRHTIVTATISGKEVKKDIRMRYFIPISK